MWDRIKYDVYEAIEERLNYMWDKIDFFIDYKGDTKEFILLVWNRSGISPYGNLMIDKKIKVDVENAKKDREVAKYIIKKIEDYLLRSFSFI